MPFLSQPPALPTELQGNSHSLLISVSKNFANGFYPSHTSWLARHVVWRGLSYKISLTSFGTILSIGAIAPLALQNAPLRRILPLSPLGGLPTIPQTPCCCIGISSLKFRYNKGIVFKRWQRSTSAAGKNHSTKTQRDYSEKTLKVNPSTLP